MGESKIVKGYKVFNPNWVCKDKQYTCPGKFEQEGELIVCENGMCFCKELIDCFSYYSFDSRIKVAEVIAYGKVVYDRDKCYTDKLEIVREISWQEVLDTVNVRSKCTGLGNTNSYNSGNWNTGTHNIGSNNTGCFNNGERNTGHYNLGELNSGNENKGLCNSGNFNRGHCNSGDFNKGDHNSGNHNTGCWNSGDWNSCNYSSGCFNTIDQKIYLFNKPSDWTYIEYLESKAYHILNCMPNSYSCRFIPIESMTDEEMAEHPEAEVTGGYIEEVHDEIDVNEWWKILHDEDKKEILSLPNFDKKIFKEMTGIDVDMCEEKTE